MPNIDQVTTMKSKDLERFEKERSLYRFKAEMEKAEQSIIEEGTVSAGDMKKELGL